MCPVIPTSNQDVRQAKNRKRGDEIKKKSSLKLLSQSQPNFDEMNHGWSPFKSVSVISDL
jgi:septation ring formation regulator EzrA